MANLEEPAPTDLHEKLVALAQQRKDLLSKAAAADDAYLHSLGDLDYASSQLLDIVESYDAYLAERLLWVRSSRPVNLGALSALPTAVGWLISPSSWLETAQVLIHEALSSPLFWMMILAVLLLLWKSRGLRAMLLATALPLRRVGTDRFTKAIGGGALAVAFGLFGFRAFSLLCIPGGVADRHFRWSSDALQTIRHNFQWAIWFLVLDPYRLPGSRRLQPREPDLCR